MGEQRSDLGHRGHRPGWHRTAARREACPRRRRLGAARPIFHARLEALEERVLLSVTASLEDQPTAEIRGSVFNDLDQDYAWDAGDPAVANREVFLDLNLNGQPDPAEPTTRTDALGNYAFTGLTPGTYHVVEVLPDGWQQLRPAMAAQSTLAIPFVAHDVVYDPLRDILYGTGDGVVHRYDFMTQSALEPIRIGSAQILGADITPDGRYLYVAGGPSGNQVTKIDLETGQQVFLTIADNEPSLVAWDLAITSQGTAYLSTGTAADNPAGLWRIDLSDGAITKETSLPIAGWHQTQEGMLSIARSPDYRYLGFAGPRSAMTYDALEETSAGYVGDYTSSSPIVALNPDGTLVGLRGEGQIKIADAALENWVWVLDQRFRNLVFDPAQDRVYGLTYRGQVVAYDTNSGWEEWRILPDCWSAHPPFPANVFRIGPVFNESVMSISPNGKLLFVPTPDGVVAVRTYAEHVVTLGVGQVVEDLDFSVKQTDQTQGKIEGIVWNDVDADGLRDPNEPGMANIRAYIDLNHNGQRDQDEPMFLTVPDDPTTSGSNEAGTYGWGREPGAYDVRIEVPAGWRASRSGDTLLQSVSLSSLATEQTGFALSKIPITVASTDPTDGARLPTPPVEIIVDFHFEVDPQSLDAADLTIDGQPAESVVLVDPDTARFVVSVLADGSHTAAIAAGAIRATWDDPIEAHQLQFTIDSTPPVVEIQHVSGFDPTPPLAGSVDDLQARIEVVLEGKTYQVLPFSDGTWYLPNDRIDPPLPPGTYDVLVRGIDVFGRAGTDATTEDLVVWPGAGLEGVKFRDLDGDGIRDAGEPGIAGATVYLDLNRNGRLDQGEPTTQTWADDPRTPSDDCGRYVFTGLAPGSYVVAEVFSEGWEQTAPYIPGISASTIVGSNTWGTSGCVCLRSSAGTMRFAGTVTGPGNPGTGQWSNGTLVLTGSTGTYGSTVFGGVFIGTLWGPDSLLSPDRTRLSPGGPIIRSGSLSSSSTTGMISGTAGVSSGGTLNLQATQAIQGGHVNITNPSTPITLSNLTQSGSLSALSVDVPPGALPRFGTLQSGTLQLAASADSGAAAAAADVVVQGTAATPASDTAGVNLLRLNTFQNDPRFSMLRGQNQAIVVLDTGADLDHPFFGPDADGDGVADRIVYQYDFVDGDASAADAKGHGTHVAGIIASQDSAFPGVAPDTDLIVLRVLGEDGMGEFDKIESALQWVLQHAEQYNIVGVNLSLSDGGNYQTPQARYGIDDELAALAQRSIIVVAAAGDDYYEHQSVPGVGYPAADRNCLAVGAVYTSSSGVFQYPTADGSPGATATSAPGVITPFSQRHGTLLDVFAPGAPITQASLDGGTATLHGTSQAAAYVSGVAALAQELAVEHLGRRLTADEFALLLRAAGSNTYDGDNEWDNVTNTNLAYAQVDMFRLAEAILALGRVPGRHVVRLGEGQVLSGLDFGGREVQVADFGAVTSNTLEGLDFAGGPRWYRAQATRSGLLTFSATLPGTSGGLTLYDANLVPVAYAPNQGGSARVDGSALAGQTCYVRLAGSGSGATLTGVNLVTWDEDRVSVHGTDGPDWFKFKAGDVPPTFIINGMPYVAMPGMTTSVAFDGGAGEDAVILIGSRNGETAEIRRGSATLAAAGMEVGVEHAEAITFRGGGGPDVGHLYGTNGNDTFTGTTSTSHLAGQGFTNRCENVATVRVYGAGGSDCATFYDSSGDETFVGGPRRADFSGGRSTTIVHDFDTVRAFSSAGGNDVARLSASAAADTFVGMPDKATLYGPGFYLRAIGFDTAEAESDAVGRKVDRAYLYDSAGDDTFEAGPDSAELRGEGYRVRAQSFDAVYAYASAGGADTAALVDSPSNDTFAAYPTYARLSGAGYLCRVESFDEVHASASAGGSDRAEFYDGAGDDTFVAWPTCAVLSGKGYRNQAEWFDAVYAYSQAGGIDVAKFHDSADDDTFVGTPTKATMYGDGYYHRVRLFEEVYAESSSGGVDEAWLYDAADEDHLSADAASVRLWSGNAKLAYLNEVSGFESVTARGASGRNTKSIAQDVKTLVLTGAWDE